METSVWTGTLSEFREKACGTDPVPASVSISAVTASLALALLAKVLAITGKRKNFTGDRERLGALLDDARAASMRLKDLADEDVRAFNQYIGSGAIREVIEVPMEAARTTVRGLEICANAAGMVRGLMAADLGAAAALLSGAVRAILLSVDCNIREMRMDEHFSDAISIGRRELEVLALRHADAIASSIGALPG